MSEIDFVITWVDPSDRKWLEQCKKHSSLNDKNFDELRFRDWGLLKYWFRAVESYAPWVRKIHFVTCGQVPEWLNIQHEKLNCVEHSDFIPHQYLPTFNSHTIELNLHRIDGLAEKFVYFNDDLFLTSSVSETFFFKQNQPRDALISNAISGSNIGHILLNNIKIINKNFNKKKSIKSNFFKWFSPKYGIDLFRNFALLPWPNFTGFVDPHMANSFLKSTFETVWQKEYPTLNSACESKFRSEKDVNQYLMRYWQLVEGNFYPQKIERHSIFYEYNDLEINLEFLFDRKIKMVCVNDGFVNDYEKAKSVTLSVFQKKYPLKSSFEL